MTKRGGQYRMDNEDAIDTLCEDCAYELECSYWENTEKGDTCQNCGCQIAYRDGNDNG